MTDPWDARWHVERKHDKPSGQGVSYRVVDRADGTPGFLKTLRRPRDTRARKRFRREATAYETLNNPGLPRLLSHNAGDWRDDNTPLYMVLEFIPGSTLGDHVHRNGPCDAEVAAACVDRIAETVGHCHAEQVVHRDLKPDNVMLRGGDLRAPVVVDFGLSFNAEPDGPEDITRVGEEVGNRFLRLPEHASGGRDPVSDVTQIAGLLLYVLTDQQPRVLVDEHGLKPHQRPAAAAALTAAVPGRLLLRLQSLFDCAFTTHAVHRFQTTDELRAALAAALAPDTDEEPDYQALLAHAREITNAPTRATNTRDAARLTAFLAAATKALRNTAEQLSLSTTQSGQRVEARAEPPYGGTSLGLGFPGAGEAILVPYRFELRHPDVVALADETEIWRGTEERDPELADAVCRAAVAQFVAANGQHRSA